VISDSQRNPPVYELAEWKALEVKGGSLSEPDRRLAQELAAGEVGRLGVEELRSGVRVTATSWVGVARFEQFEVRVVPKLAGGTLGLVEMIEFATGLNALRRSSGIRTLATEGANLFDLVALLLAEGCERIARGGLLADYVEMEDELPAVRGRLLGDRQVLKRFGQVDRVVCRYDELEQDVVENQLLAAALGKCARRVKDDSVRLRVGRLRSLFAEACRPEKLNLEAARWHLTYNRQNAHYRDPHALAWLVLDGLRAVKDIYTPGRTRCFAFLLDMNLLFEKFIHRLFELILDGGSYSLDYQRSDKSIVWDADKNQPYSRVIPDLLVRSRRPPFGRLAVDAKYKLYDERKVSPADVYQSFLYAYAFGGGDAERASPPVALIVYPSAAGQPKSLRLSVRRTGGLAGAEIHGFGVPITECLSEVRSGVRGPSLTVLREAVDKAVSPAQPNR
jgi:5-methylcytosine-specific restriction enzyme subunit McrC